MTIRQLLALVPALTLGSAEQEAGIERVAWLQGCWRAVSPRRIVEENWTAPRGRSMVGVSRTLRGDSLIAYELVVVQQQGPDLTYQAHPSGQPSAVFTAKVVTDSMVIFENEAHDFPQRVGYRRALPDSLVAWIEGTAGSRKRRIEFPYARTECPGR